MKRKIYGFMLLLMVVVVSSAFSNTIYAATIDEYTPRYEVNAPDWTEEALLQYYVDNKIFPANIEPGVGDALIQYLDSNSNWVAAFDLQEDISYPYLSTLVEYPTGITCRFDGSTYTFRFYVEAFNPSGDRNKGRLVIEEMNGFFSTEL